MALSGNVLSQMLELWQVKYIFLDDEKHEHAKHFVEMDFIK